MYNNCVEMVLVAFLIVIMYKIPKLLADAVNNRVGKFMFICLIIVTHKKYNMNSAIILSIMFILILRHNYDGLESFSNYENIENGDEEDDETVDKPRRNNMVDLNRKIKLFSENNTVQSTRE